MLQLRIVLLELRDGILYIHRVTLVIEPQNWARIAPRNERIAFSTPRIPYLRRRPVEQDGDLLRQEPPYLHQIVHHRGGFFRVAGSVVEDVAIRWIAPQ